ncbi:hypothetical protein [Rodentibacter rarus]|uniref:hypothetical protein n=1 Tax=Rodentibacter rarus TaxID=1908260 RepID=UPI00351CE6ED
MLWLSSNDISIKKNDEHQSQRNFVAPAPNERWGTDVSEFKCAEGKLYLSPIKDLFNGEIIAYDLAPSPNFGLITGMM